MSDGDVPVKKTESYEITMRIVGGTPVYELRGRYVDDILPSLREIILDEQGDVALRTEELSGVGAPMARELIYLAKQVERRGGDLVLINPDPNLKNYVQIIYEDDTIQILHSVKDLEDPADGGVVHDVREAASKTADELRRIERELNGNYAWQMRDREGNWLCPFCGDLQTRIQISSLGTFTTEVAEKVFRHLREECDAWRSGQKVPLPTVDLQEKLEAIDAEKAAVAASRVMELEAEAERKEVLEEQYEVARARQRSLLPSEEPEIPGIDTSIWYEPGETLSGDFFDFVELPDGSTVLTIGDATGKGISGSLLMAVTKKVLQLRLRESETLAEALVQANEDLEDELEGASFATAFCGVIDPEALTLRYVRAGHFPPILLNPGREPDLTYLDGRGMPLGVGPSDTFGQMLAEEEVELRAGDVIALYTDGVKEARDPIVAEAFETERIVEVLRDHYDESASAMTGGIHVAVDEYTGGERADDTTFIVLKVA